MMRHLLSLVLVVSLVGGPSVQAAETQNREVRVTAEGAKVLAAPSAQGRVLQRVPRGEVLRVVEESGEWYLVTAPGIQPGFVNKALVEVVVSAPIAGGAPPADVPPGIAHDPMACMQAQENALALADVTAQSQVQKSRVYFKAHQYPDWYYVDMKAPNRPRFLALLPQPLPDTQKVDYYIYALDTTMQTARTDQYEPPVSASCQTSKPGPGAGLDPAEANQIVIGGTKEGQPPIPPGFNKKGIIAFVAVTGAVIAGAALSSAASVASAGTTASAGAGASGGAGAAAGGGGMSGAAVAGIVVGGVAVVGGAGYVAYNAVQGSSDEGDSGGSTGQPGTGDIAFRLSWSTGADLDLYVQEPNGNVIYYGNPSSSTGGRLDVDSNSSCANLRSNPIENVYWPTGRAPRGTYRFWVQHFGCGAASSFTLQVLRGIGGSVASSNSGFVNSGQQSTHYSFVY